MAKKKDGGTNTGLIVTLVIFVLTTVILGVTTYMGYSNIDEKEKANAKMKQELDQSQNDAKWYRTQSRIYRAWVRGDVSPGVEAAEVAREKQQLEQGQLSHASNQKDKDDFTKVMQDLNARMPWGATNTPSKSYDQWIQDKDRAIEGLRGDLKKSQDAVARVTAEKTEAEQSATKEITGLRTALDDVKKKSGDDRKKDLDDLAAKAAQVEQENKRFADERRKNDEMAKELEKLTVLNKKMQGQLAAQVKETRELKEQLNDAEARVAALAERQGIDARTVAASAMDARATQAIKEWKHDWKIVDMDRTGRLPYINLGTSAGLTSQITFSIHSVGADGKLNPLPKGTLEVVRIIGSQLAQTRVTSVRDAKADPIVKGDRLFNPTWDPFRKKHVAIAGLADLGGEGTDNTDDLRRLLGRQNVEIDAYIDVKDEKMPKIMGKGITINTDYLILADTLEGVNHPKARDKDFATQFDKQVRELKDKATTTGVPVISLKKYLDMIGYRAPRIISTGSGR
jgi:hypothetical protein